MWCLQGKKTQEKTKQKQNLQQQTPQTNPHSKTQVTKAQSLEGKDTLLINTFQV